MKKQLRWVLIGLLVLSAAGMAFAAPKETGQATNLRESDPAKMTALDRYIAKPDPNYKYELVNTFEGDGTTGYVLGLTSQQWRTATEVDRPVWTHWVTIAVPKKVKSTTALMVIGGGSNKDQAPKGGDVKLHVIAKATNAITAEISNIPNEPLVFSDDQKRRSEDSIIAYTWDKYLRTGDEEWPLRLPMTKAVVRAMDAIQEFCASSRGGKNTIETFVPAGGSKRGWTTWTVGVVDKRVVAIAPAVIDLLNIIPSFRHHKAVYGRWAPAIDDYEQMGIMEWMETPEYAAMMKIVEPYSYLDRLTMPKFIMASGGDQFFLPDSWKFYWDDLKGPKWIRYVPNTGHGLNATAYESLQAFFGAIAHNEPIPEITWTFVDDATVRVQANAKPSSVKLWQGTNPEHRDFRVDVAGEIYKATDLAPEADGSYIGKVEKSAQGWTAYLIELQFPGKSGAPFTFTTPIRILPDTYEHEYVPVPNPPKGFLTK
ncbi:MAG TPA: PhoPQ-activated pathogenicity-related family protein [Candidatus Hydrogenedentes bacterium]|nr:PhoPQ-activated pathogenicity-related family protein [Candidatus Hydrogenedentota bacterium]HRT19260.1 PhoPQ-activated pathogenicity-related family protein [Candidatus Hydrogenedentota bacterium]HRT63340.1 PhoPQ-activated pathogenicity-related family protein [Candidatus Hydrogenedentota bacterium]